MKAFDQIRRLPKTPKGAAGYDNPRENIDPHLKTQVLSSREGSVEKVPVNDNDIVNKKYFDDELSDHEGDLQAHNYVRNDADDYKAGNLRIQNELIADKELRLKEIPWSPGFVSGYGLLRTKYGTGRLHYINAFVGDKKVLLEDDEGLIDHDQLLNFVSAEHFVQSDITTTGTISSGVWNGSALTASYVPDHDDLNGFVANEHIDWTNAGEDFETTGTVQAAEITTDELDVGPKAEAYVLNVDGSGHASAPIYITPSTAGNGIRVGGSCVNSTTGAYVYRAGTTVAFEIENAGSWEYIQFCNFATPGYTRTATLKVWPDTSTKKIAAVWNSNTAPPLQHFVNCNSGTSGSSWKRIVEKTSNYTATVDDNTILVDCTSGNVTVTLPTAASSKVDNSIDGGSDDLGLILKIKRIDSSGNTVTIDGNGSETIDGSTTQTLGALEWMQIQSDGVDWWVIG